MLYYGEYRALRQPWQPKSYKSRGNPIKAGITTAYVLRTCVHTEVEVCEALYVHVPQDITLMCVRLQQPGDQYIHSPRLLSRCQTHKEAIIRPLLKKTLMA